MKEAQHRLDPNCMIEAMSNFNETSVKVVTERYVDSPSDIEDAVDDTPPPMTLSRAKQLIDQGLHVHDGSEYIHTLVQVKDAKKIHGMWHLPITAADLGTIMKDATFDIGDCSF